MKTPRTNHDTEPPGMECHCPSGYPITAFRDGGPVKEHHRGLCGPCDFGLVEMGCACPTGDYRHLMQLLVAEVRRRRDELNDLSELAARLASAIEFVAGLARPLTTGGVTEGTNEREALQTIASTRDALAFWIPAERVTASPTSRATAPAADRVDAPARYPTPTEETS